MSKKLGMIGGGVMGEALISRLIVQGTFAPEEILVAEPNAERRAYLAQKYGVGVTEDNSQTTSAETLFLAIKPQIFTAVTQDLIREDGSTGNPATLVISILAGVPLVRLEAAFPSQPVIRAMPNTPATVGEGVTAIAAGHFAEREHLERAQQIFQAVGEVVEVPEYLMDAVTGLSGSGPGYVAIVIEALTDGGVAAGLPRVIAEKLALQTVLGTAKLLQSTNLHPATLKDRVTSPGGTTITGIAALEKAGLRSALIEAVQAASARSKELGS